MAVKLFDNETGAELGILSEAQLQFLIDQLEEETSEDRDYYLNPTTLELMEKEGGDPQLIALLRRAMGEKDGIEIRWARVE